MDPLGSVNDSTVLRIPKASLLSESYPFFRVPIRTSLSKALLKLGFRVWGFFNSGKFQTLFPANPKPETFKPFQVKTMFAWMEPNGDTKQLVQFTSRSVL